MIKYRTELLDADGNALHTVKYHTDRNQHWVGEMVDGVVVASLQLITIQLEESLEERREERTEEFSQTLDKLNSAWWDSLTDTEKTEVNTYRASWLDYPSTGVKPTRPSIFN